MVFGWGKKKNQEPEASIQEEKKIKLSEIKSKIDEIQSLRAKTIITVIKFGKNLATLQGYLNGF